MKHKEIVIKRCFSKSRLSGEYISKTYQVIVPVIKRKIIPTKLLINTKTILTQTKMKERVSSW